MVADNDEFDRSQINFMDSNPISPEYLNPTPTESQMAKSTHENFSDVHDSQFGEFSEISENVGEG